MALYKSIWTQICEHFSDYSYKLIFESANEELGDRLNDGEVTGTDGVLSEDECYETTNRINSEFVKLVRSTGGKNADRFLLIAGYNTDFRKTCDDRYQMPEDTAKDKLLLSVHYYTPWDYCSDSTVNQWGISRRLRGCRIPFFYDAAEIHRPGIRRGYRRICRYGCGG